MRYILIGLLALFLSPAAKADMQEIDFSHLNIVDYVISAKCFDSYTKAAPRMYERPYQIVLENQWTISASYITDGSYFIQNNRDQTDLSQFTGFSSVVGGWWEPGRIQWNDSGLIIQAGGDSAHCRGFGAYMDTTYLDWHAKPGNALGGGGVSYGYIWEPPLNANQSGMVHPWAVNGQNLMVQVSNVKVPVSYVENQDLYHANMLGPTLYFVHPSGRAIDLVVSVYDSRPDYFHATLNCGEGISTDNIVLFAGTFLGTSTGCSRQGIEYITPSPYSAFSVGGGTFTSPKFFRFHITEKDLEDQLQDYQTYIIANNNDGDPNTPYIQPLSSSEMQAEQWGLALLTMISEFTPNGPDNTDILRFGFSASNLAAYIVTNQ